MCNDVAKIVYTQNRNWFIPEINKKKIKARKELKNND